MEEHIKTLKQARKALKRLADEAHKNMVGGRGDLIDNAYDAAEELNALIVKLTKGESNGKTPLV